MRTHRHLPTGAFISGIGIALNLLLSAGKLTVGLLLGLVSVTADGFNNLSDCGSGVIALVSFFISEKPADKEHPYGHRRAEYLAAMATGFLILLLAVETFRGSVVRIIEDGARESSLVVFLVLGISIVLKAGMLVLYSLFAGRLGSQALKAAARDSLCDCIATAAVIVGMGLHHAGIPADGWVGCVVSLFILWQGIKLLWDASSELLGHAPDPALVERIGRMIGETEGVLGFHDLHLFSYGRGATFASVHVEMDAALPALEAHGVIDGIEARIREQTGVELTVHFDPVDLKDEEEARLAAAVREAVKGLAEGSEIHDLRLNQRTRTVEFDAGIPYACRLSDEELLARLKQIVRDMGDYEPHIHIERE